MLRFDKNDNKYIDTFSDNQTNSYPEKFS